MNAPTPGCYSARIEWGLGKTLFPERPVFLIREGSRSGFSVSLIAFFLMVKLTVVGANG